MFDPKKDWLPIGTIVCLEGAERLVMLAGYLSIQAENGHVWDYVGYLYPEGNQHDDVVFFQRDSIEEVTQIGFLDADGLAALKELEHLEPEYVRKRAQYMDTIEGLTQSTDETDEGDCQNDGSTND